MLETSKDLLYVVIAFCVLWLTVFFCWMLYYVAMLLKQAYDLTRSIKEKLEKVDALIDFAKNKIEKTSSHLGLVAAGVGQLVKFLINRRAEGVAAKTKKKK
ncbi:hypothetical protein HY933_03400 [Candidatus Falkowbacteria bacterium]|nr:hypothetical protein [Candidatus Falkowbacteria bacterium]